MEPDLRGTNRFSFIPRANREIDLLRHRIARASPRVFSRRRMAKHGDIVIIVMQAINLSTAFLRYEKEESES